jgi:hypothetical protein
MQASELISMCYDKSWIGSFPHDRIDKMRTKYRLQVEKERDEIERRRKVREETRIRKEKERKEREETERLEREQTEGEGDDGEEGGEGYRGERQRTGGAKRRPHTATTQ